MKEFTIHIQSRPLGVRFAHADRGETVVVHLVLEGHLGDKLGLKRGDILVAVGNNSVLDKTSSQALDLFRSQALPFKASFRRFDEEDDFEDDEESQDEDTQFMRDETERLLMTTHQYNDSKASSIMKLDDWSPDDVQEWLKNYGRALGNEDRFKKYISSFKDNKINGKILSKLDRIDLSKMGINDDDCHDIYVGIRELNNIINISTNNKQKEEEQEDTEEEEKNNENNNNNNEEDDNWEQPFLPYMYNAPTVKLNEKTKVSVCGSRIVQPFKKRGFALYEIEVIDGDNEWLLSKRYSEFYKLNVSINKLGIKPKYKFPNKGILKKSTDKKIMENRKLKLTQWLNCLLQDHPLARNCKELNDFLSPSRTFVVEQ